MRNLKNPEMFFGEFSLIILRIYKFDQQIIIKQRFVAHYL